MERRLKTDLIKSQKENMFNSIFNFFFIQACFSHCIRRYEKYCMKNIALNNNMNFSIGLSFHPDQQNAMISDTCMFI